VLAVFTVSTCLIVVFCHLDSILCLGIDGYMMV
jgi:hypothetical protein